MSELVMPEIRFGKVKLGQRFWWKGKLWERERHCFAARVSLADSPGPKSIHFGRHEMVSLEHDADAKEEANERVP